MGEQQKRENINQPERDIKNQPIDAPDVSKRKISEKMLRESQKRFQVLVEMTSDFIWETNTDGVYTYCSPQAEELWGYTPEELIGSSAFRYIKPEYRENYINMFKALLENSSPVKRMEATGFLDKTGKIITLEVSTVPFFDNGGKLVGYRGISRDITEKKRIENALRESEEKYRTLVENASEVVVVAQDGMIKFINKKGFEMTGYSPGEIAGKPFLEFIHPDNRALVMDRYLGRIAGEVVPYYYEIRVLTKDRSTRWARMSAARITWEKKPAILAIFNDITERKGAEDALKESEAKANALIRYAPTGIYEMDFRGTRFISMNDTMCKITGYTREELLSMKPTELLDKDGLRLFYEKVKRKLAGEKVEQTADFKVRRKDGSFIYVTLQSAFSQSDPDRVFVIAHDITERKILEQNLQTYARRITEVQEEERKRIAYELHDDTAQYLALLKMELGALLQSGKIQDPEVIKNLQYLEKDADRAFYDVRRYSHELRPVVLEHMGLLAALEQIAEDYNRLGQIKVEVNARGSEPKYLKRSNWDSSGLLRKPSIISVNMPKPLKLLLV